MTNSSPTHNGPCARAEYVIMKHGCFYRPHAAGYTRYLDEAGRYTRQEVEAEADRAEGITFMTAEDAASRSTSRAPTPCVTPDIITRLEKALEPFAAMADHCDDVDARISKISGSDHVTPGAHYRNVRLADCQAAREALRSLSLARGDLENCDALSEVNQQPPRSSTDYAIEFGEYLAKSAESFLNFLNTTGIAAHAKDQDGLTDHWRGLQSRIYEFRKRATRAKPNEEITSVGETELATQFSNSIPRSQEPETATCERCQGNGEIVLDWEMYRHPTNLEAEERSVSECPDCDGTGRTIPTPRQEPETASEIDTLINYWSMCPQPDTPEGKAWEAGARQGWQWALVRPQEPETARRPVAFRVVEKCGNVSLYDNEDAARRVAKASGVGYDGLYTSTAPRQEPETAKLIEALVEAAVSTCEPENGSDASAAHTRRVLTGKFSTALARSQAAPPAREVKP